MPVEVFVADEQSSREVDCERWAALAEATLAKQRVRGEAELSVLFVDEKTIAALNERFLGHEGPTDVLSFPIEDGPAPSGRSPDGGGNGPGWEPPDDDELPTLLGDVVICPEVAWRNAPEHAGTYEDEIALLIVHGILHLLGMDHEIAEEAEAMEARERELLGELHRPLGAAAFSDPETASPGTAPAGGTAPSTAGTASPETAPPATSPGAGTAPSATSPAAGTAPSATSPGTTAEHETMTPATALPGTTAPETAPPGTTG
jgi:probable rRNA maturation factor